MKQKLLYVLFGIKPVKGKIDKIYSSKPVGIYSSTVPIEYLKTFQHNDLDKMNLRNVKTI